MPLKRWLTAALSLVLGTAASGAEPPSTAPSANSPASQPASALQFTVEDVFYIKPPVDRVILVGTITQGTVFTGQKATVRTANGPVEVVVEEIDAFTQNNLKKASKGDQVALRLTGIKKDEPSRGDKVTDDDGE
jgi:translation elongation factor EF-1alpha